MVQHLHRDEIGKYMEESGLTPNDQGWLQKFQWSVNEVIKSLGGNDKVSEKYGEVAKSRNEAGLPEELRRK